MLMVGLVFQIVDDVLDVTSTTGAAGQAHWQRQRKWQDHLYTLYGLTVQWRWRKN